jgi:hypothetical protein
MALSPLVGVFKDDEKREKKNQSTISLERSDGV